MLFASPLWRIVTGIVFYCCVLPSSLALTLPLTAVAAQQTQTPAASDGAKSEPTLEEKKAAYAALENILENNDSRQELIEQLAWLLPVKPPPTNRC